MTWHTFRYFVVGFLFRAMKRSHDLSGGRGARIILPLFKSLLTDLRHRCIDFIPSASKQISIEHEEEESLAIELIEQSKQILSNIEDDDLLPYFMKGFSATSEGKSHSISTGLVFAHANG